MPMYKPFSYKRCCYNNTLGKVMLHQVFALTCASLVGEGFPGFSFYCVGSFEVERRPLERGP